MSNNTNELCKNCYTIGFNCKQNFNQQFNNNGMDSFVYTDSKDGQQASEWKSKLKPLLEFLDGYKKFYMFSNWNANYNLLHETYQNNIQALNIVNEFDNFISVFSSNQFKDELKILIKYYLYGIKNPSKKNKYPSKETQQKLPQKYQNKTIEQIIIDVGTEISNMFNSQSDGILIVENIKMYYEQRKNQTVQNLMATVKASVPYQFVQNTVVIKNMTELMNNE